MLDYIPATVSESWRAEYRPLRYLREMEEDQLSERLAYLVENLATLEPDGSPGVLPLDAPLWRSLIDTHEEIVIREDLKLLEVLKKLTATIRSYPRGSQSSNAYFRRKNEQHGQFYKFDRSRFLKEVVDRGRLRLFPGSHYSDPSLNSARRDNELVFNWSARSESIRLTLPDGNRTYAGAIQKFGGRTNYDCDFYVWCVSDGLHDRLLTDFESDCFLAFYDMNAFLRSIKEAIQTSLNGWSLYFDRVTYTDPWNVGNWTQLPAIPFCKHHKYFYQHEWRIVIHPEHRALPPLSPLDLKLKFEPNILELITP